MMFKLFKHYLQRGYGARIAFRLARNRSNESKRAVTLMGGAK